MAGGKDKAVARKSQGSKKSHKAKDATVKKRSTSSSSSSSRRSTIVTGTASPNDVPQQISKVPDAIIAQKTQHCDGDEKDDEGGSLSHQIKEPAQLQVDGVLGEDDSVSPATPAKGLNHYLDPIHWGHPAHHTTSKSEPLKAMIGNKGRRPTDEEVKKGLRTLSEQRRRWSINEGYEHLRLLVPYSETSAQATPLARASVLSRAASYIQHLIKYVGQLKKALKDRDVHIKKLVESSLGAHSSKYHAITSLLEAEAEALEVFSPPRLWALEPLDSLGPPSPPSPNRSPKEKLHEISVELASIATAAEKLLHSPEKRRKVTHGHEELVTVHSSQIPAKQCTDGSDHQSLVNHHVDDSKPAGCIPLQQSANVAAVATPLQVGLHSLPEGKIYPGPHRPEGHGGANLMPTTPQPIDLSNGHGCKTNVSVSVGTMAGLPFTGAAAVGTAHAPPDFAQHHQHPILTYTSGLTLAFPPHVPASAGHSLSTSDASSASVSTSSCAPLSYTSSPSQLSISGTTPELANSVEARPLDTAVHPSHAPSTIMTGTMPSQNSAANNGNVTSHSTQCKPPFHGAEFLRAMSGRPHMTFEETQAYIASLQATMAAQRKGLSPFPPLASSSLNTSIVESKRRVSKDLTTTEVDRSSMTSLPTLKNLRIHTDSVRPIRKRRSGTPVSAGPVSAFPPIPATNALGLAVTEPAPLAAPAKLLSSSEPLLTKEASQSGMQLEAVEKHVSTTAPSIVAAHAAAVPSGPTAALAEWISPNMSVGSLSLNVIQASATQAAEQTTQEIIIIPESPIDDQYLLPPITPRSTDMAQSSSMATVTAADNKVEATLVPGLTLPIPTSAGLSGSGYSNGHYPSLSLSLQAQQASVTESYLPYGGVQSFATRPPLKRKHAATDSSNLSAHNVMAQQQQLHNDLPQSVCHQPILPSLSFGNANSLELLPGVTYSNGFAPFDSHTTFTGSALAACGPQTFFQPASTWAPSNCNLIYNGTGNLLPTFTGGSGLRIGEPTLPPKRQSIDLLKGFPKTNQVFHSQNRFPNPAFSYNHPIGNPRHDVQVLQPAPPIPLKHPQPVPGIPSVLNL